MEHSPEFNGSLEGLSNIEKNIQKLIDRLLKHHSEEKPRIEKLSKIDEKVKELEHTFDLVIGKVEEVEELSEEELEEATAPEIEPLNPYQ